MEFEQIIKRLDWLDEERRKDKTTLAEVEKHVSRLESDLKIINKKLKEINNSLAELASTPARFEQYETAVNKTREEISKLIGATEKRTEANQTEYDKRVQLQLEGVNKTLQDLKKTKKDVSDVRRDLKTREDEEARRDKVISEWEKRIKASLEKSEEAQQTVRAAEDGRRQDAKRLADLQGEINASRKRLEDAKERSDVTSDSIRRLEVRVNEMLASEVDRRQAQTNFIEAQSRAQVERDRAWKDWEEQVSFLHNQTETMDSYLQEWEVAQRAVKRAQETYEDIIQKYERRINEITEMQRLAEDRFRQEWVTFKADDQKRWVSYTLSQEEQLRDSRSRMDKFDARLTSLDDLTQTHQDVLALTKEANQQLLQALLAQIHELLNAYDRAMGTK